MGDQLVVSVSQIERLSQELTAAADELRAHANQFARDAVTTADAYGRLPVSQEAAAQDVGAAREVLAQVERLERAYRDEAEALRVAARRLGDAEADNIGRAGRVG